MSAKIIKLDGSEKSMIPLIREGINAIKSPKNGQSLVALEEFSAGTGISDLTIFTIDKTTLSKRQDTKLPAVTSRTHLEVLIELLSQEAASASDIHQHLKKYSLSVIESSLETLKRQSIVCLNAGGAYEPCMDLRVPIANEIVAIEAKVRDWRSGLRQAMRYQEFADQSYLAIYQKHLAGCLEHAKLFESLGIGLISVSDEGIKVHIKATSCNAQRTAKLLAAERCLSLAYEGYEPFKVRNNLVANNA